MMSIKDSTVKYLIIWCVVAFMVMSVIFIAMNNFGRFSEFTMTIIVVAIFVSAITCITNFVIDFLDIKFETKDIQK